RRMRTTLPRFLERIAARRPAVEKADFRVAARDRPVDAEQRVFCKVAVHEPRCSVEETPVGIYACRDGRHRVVEPLHTGDRRELAPPGYCDIPACVYNRRAKRRA